MASIMDRGFLRVRNGNSNSNSEAREDIYDFEEGLLLKVCNVNRNYIVELTRQWSGDVG
jgi:hypothetical protein